MARPSKELAYLSVAKAASLRSTCLNMRCGVVIVKNDQVISTGYNGAPRTAKNCCDIGTCRLAELKLKGTDRHDMCRGVHAELNAIISASRADMIGSVLFLVGTDSDGEVIEEITLCSGCKKAIMNAGIEKVIIATSDTSYETQTPFVWSLKDEI